YDYPYVTQEEGYPGLIVHGPLIATLLLDLLRRERPQVRVTEFSFRAKRPLFSPHPFSVRGWPAADGRSVRLVAVNPEGSAAMVAEAVLAAWPACSRVSGSASAPPSGGRRWPGWPS